MNPLLVTRGLLGLIVAIFAIAPLTGDVAAQDPPPRPALFNSMTPRAQAMVRDEQQRDGQDADRLSLEAHQMEAALKWSNAATRHEAAAWLRPNGDMRAAVAFTNAARSYYGAGNLSDAARSSELAGVRALDLGDVHYAAMSFRNAAMLHQRQGKKVRAQELGWRACRLSSSPNLDDREREAVQRSLNGCTSSRRSPELAVAPWLLH